MTHNNVRCYKLDLSEALFNAIISILSMHHRSLLVGVESLCKDCLLRFCERDEPNKHGKFIWEMAIAMLGAEEDAEPQDSN